MATHFTGPILFAGKDGQRKWFSELPIDKNPDYVVYMDDFTGVAFDDTNDWTVVKDSGASVGIAADVVGGAITMSSAATTDNDGSSIQGNEVFAVEAGRDIWFETKLTPTDAEGDAMDLCVGLTVNFSTNPEAMLTAADRIVFQVDDGDSVIDCITEKNGTATSTATDVEIVSGTAVTLGFHVKSTGAVEFFINRNLVATHATNIPDDENLAMGVMQLSGSSTGTKSISVDYVFAAQTR